MPWSRRLSTCFGAWPHWAHPSRPFIGPICLGRNHSQVYPHMRAKFGHDRSSRLAAYTWQTHTEFVLYRYVSPPPLTIWTTWYTTGTWRVCLLTVWRLALCTQISSYVIRFCPSNFSESLPLRIKPLPLPGLSLLIGQASVSQCQCPSHCYAWLQDNV